MPGHKGKIVKKKQGRIKSIHLDHGPVKKFHPSIDKERETAICDLLAENSFFLRDLDLEHHDYHLRLEIKNHSVLIQVMTENEVEVDHLTLPLGLFRKIVKDYFLICESYFTFNTSSNYAKLEAIDMGRRGVHNEGAEILMKALDHKVDLDLETARRIFTLICVLHFRGV